MVRWVFQWNSRFVRPAARALVPGLLSLAVLSACTEYGYYKPGITDAEYIRDSEDCAQIAQRQAFRDANIYRPWPVPDRSFRRGIRSTPFSHDRVSRGELEFRYRRVCMQSKGYELMPLDEVPADAAPVPPVPQ